MVSGQVPVLVCVFLGACCVPPWGAMDVQEVEVAPIVAVEVAQPVTSVRERLPGFEAPGVDGVHLASRTKAGEGVRELLWRMRAIAAASLQ